LSTCRRLSAGLILRRGIHDVHNDNICPLVYTLEVEINVLDFDRRYPKNPQTLGEKLRKARMDRKMTLKEVSALLGVSDTSVLNWKIRGKIPEESRMGRVKEFLEGKPNSEIS
jgi:predicted DNA-binding transcriptional regulator AlpA